MHTLFASKVYVEYNKIDCWSPLNGVLQIVSPSETTRLWGRWNRLKFCTFVVFDEDESEINLNKTTPHEKWDEVQPMRPENKHRETIYKSTTNKRSS